MSVTTETPPGPRDDGGSTLTADRPATIDRVRWVARGVGQTLITAGLVILLFVVYEVWVTNIFAASQQATVAEKFKQTLDQPAVGDPNLPLPSTGQKTVPAGTGVANLYIPRFGKDYVFTVVQGVDDADLEKGPGHYSNTADPGAKGNFSVAGHRVGKGEPFLNLDQLVPGDKVVVQVPGYWFVYQVLGQNGDLGVRDANGVPGREIVSPTNVSVIAPTPDNSGAVATGSYMTMTTCHPKYSASQRMVVHAGLVATKPASGGTLPTELGGTL